jgi:hypothetical protein
MIRVGISVGLVVLVVANNLSAADSPEVTALKQQVKTLKAQKPATLKAIHAQYDAVINQSKLTDAQLSAARKTLHDQENDLNGLGGSSGDTKTMQDNMQTLRKAMLGEMQVDGAVRNTLRTQRANHVKLVAAAYDAKIKELEAAIKAAPKPTTSTSAKPKTK